MASEFLFRLIKRTNRQGQYPYYGASGIIDSIDGYTHDGEYVLIGEDGANLLARSTPIAFLAKGKIWVNNHTHVIKCKNNLPNDYLSYFINSIDLSPYVTGTAQPKLTQGNMNKIPYLLLHYLNKKKSFVVSNPFSAKQTTLRHNIKRRWSL